MKQDQMPSLDELLASNRALEEMPEETRDRVIDRLEASLMIPPLGSPPTDGTGPGGDGGASASTGASVASAAVASSGAAKALLVGIGVVVGVSGHAAYQSIRHTDDSPPAVSAAAASPSWTAASVPSPPLIAPSASSESVPRVAEVSPSASPSALPANTSAAAANTAAERILIETARAALARMQPESALEALRKHAERYPHGALAEERESLWIQALVQAGRSNDARSRAERFRKQSPDSLFGPAIDMAVEADAGPTGVSEKSSPSE